MATFLLYWNPHFSSYKLDRFLNDFRFPAGKVPVSKFLPKPPPRLRR